MEELIGGNEVDEIDDKICGELDEKNRALNEYVHGQSPENVI